MQTVRTSTHTIVRVKRMSVVSSMLEPILVDLFPIIWGSRLRGRRVTGIKIQIVKLRVPGSRCHVRLQIPAWDVRVEFPVDIDAQWFCRCGAVPINRVQREADLLDFRSPFSPHKLSLGYIEVRAALRFNARRNGKTETESGNQCQSRTENKRSHNSRVSYCKQPETVACA